MVDTAKERNGKREAAIALLRMIAKSQATSETALTPRTAQVLLDEIEEDRQELHAYRTQVLPHCARIEVALAKALNEIDKLKGDPSGA